MGFPAHYLLLALQVGAIVTGEPDHGVVSYAELTEGLAQGPHLGVHRGDVAVIDLLLNRTVRVLLHQFGVLAQRGMHIVEPNYRKEGFLGLGLLSDERNRLVHYDGRVVTTQSRILLPLLERDVTPVVPIQTLDAVLADFGIGVVGY